MLKGDAKTAYQREYMRQRRAAAKAGAAAGREAKAQPAADLEAEVARLRAENQRLEDEIARLGGLPHTAEGLRRARLVAEERTRAERVAKRAEREPRKQAAAAAPVASPEALQAENERLTKLRERDRTE